MLVLGVFCLLRFRFISDLQCWMRAWFDDFFHGLKLMNKDKALFLQYTQGRTTEYDRILCDPVILESRCTELDRNL